MTKPFPCFCECNPCTDWSQPWYGRGCDWFDGVGQSGYPSLNGLVVNFGVITPTSDPQFGMMGESTISMTPPSASYVIPGFQLNPSLMATATLTLSTIALSQTLRIWYSLGNPCKRKFQVFTKRTLKVVAISDATSSWATTPGLQDPNSWSEEEYYSFHFNTASGQSVNNPGADRFVVEHNCETPISIPINAAKSTRTWPAGIGTPSPNSSLLRFVGPTVNFVSYDCFHLGRTGDLSTAVSDPYEIQHSSIFTPCEIAEPEE